MPSMTLLPDATSGHTTHWVDYPATTHHAALSNDNGDTSYVYTSSNARYITLGYANPSVSEAEIESITSVRFTSSGRSTDRSNPSLVDISFAAPTAGFSETCSYDTGVSYEQIDGTARTTSDGSNPWTYADLENLQMKCTKNGTVQVRLSYLALIVLYVEAVTDNAIFFGTNF